MDPLYWSLLAWVKILGVQTINLLNNHKVEKSV